MKFQTEIYKFNQINCNWLTQGFVCMKIENTLNLSSNTINDHGRIQVTKINNKSSRLSALKKINTRENVIRKRIYNKRLK